MALNEEEVLKRSGMAKAIGIFKTYTHNSELEFELDDEEGVVVLNNLDPDEVSEEDKDVLDYYGFIFDDSNFYSYEHY